MLNLSQKYFAYSICCERRGRIISLFDEPLCRAATVGNFVFSLLPNYGSFRNVNFARLEMREHTRAIEQVSILIFYYLAALRSGDCQTAPPPSTVSLHRVGTISTKKRTCCLRVSEHTVALPRFVSVRLRRFCLCMCYLSSTGLNLCGPASRWWTSAKLVPQ